MPISETIITQESQEDKLSSSIPAEVPSAKVSNQEVVSIPDKNTNIAIPSELPITNPSYIKVKTLPRFLKQSLNTPSDINNYIP